MGIPAVDPPIDDQEAKEVLSVAYQGLFGDDEPNLFALGIAQAIGLMEGNYGRWGPGGKSNNWGAITSPKNSDGSCPSGTFQHGDSSFEAGKVQACFKLYPTSLEGATDLLQQLYVNRPDTFQAAINGDIREVAKTMYTSNYYQGVAPHDQKDSNGDFTNVNNYIKFIGRGIDQIADLYPHGGEEVADTGSNTGLIVGLAVAAVVGVAVVAKLS